MKNRNQEAGAASDPDDDYSLRYGTQSFDALPKSEPEATRSSSATHDSNPFEGIDDHKPLQPEPSTPPVAHDPYDGFDDYSKRHGAASDRGRYDGFDGYAERHALGGYGRRSATPGDLGRAAVALVVFIVAFKIIFASFWGQSTGALGIGGLILIGIAGVGALVTTVVVVGIVAICFKWK